MKEKKKEKIANVLKNNNNCTFKARNLFRNVLGSLLQLKNNCLKNNNKNSNKRADTS